MGHAEGAGAVSRIPWRLVGYALFALFLIGSLNHYAGFIPFTPQWSAKRAVAKVERLEGQVSTLEREASGNEEIRGAVETYHTREVIVRETAATAINEARNAPDASTPLADERANRLRRHDDSLCIDAPTLCAPADAS